MGWVRTQDIESLYQQALAGNVGAICFWLKNRRPSEWRDVQQIDSEVGHYIISDRPMTPEQWIAERTKVLDAERLPEPENQSLG